jgi:predicted amidophosphoribosyltransferase
MRGDDQPRLATLWKPGAALVPTPPSKPIGDPNYDDRMLQIARRSHAPDGPPTPVLDVLKQARRLHASHVTARRPQIDTLVKAYALEDTPLAPERLIFLDDILTTGRHFRAMTEVLRRRFPAAEIVGLFIARRVWNEPGLSEAVTGVADWGPPPKS